MQGIWARAKERIPTRRWTVLATVVLATALGLGWLGSGGTVGEGGGAGRDASSAAPVEVAHVERGAIVLRRTFTGSLEPLTQFDVAPKVGGRIERLDVDVGDTIERGQLVAELDSDEFVQEVALAEAELAVAQANSAEARSRGALSERSLERITRLASRGIVSESELDSARVEQQAAQATLKVAEAQVERARAALASARIRLGYTRVAAAWVGGDERRVVAARFVEPGDTVSENTPLVSVVEIDPIKAVVTVTERDYGRLSPGMPARLSTDAYPGRRFEAETALISPVFEEASRQARVELLAPNGDQALKPGMFVRATMILDRAENALLVPEAALTRRDGQDGVFVVVEDGSRVAWRPVRVGIRDGGSVQVAAQGELDGRVVTLGQQLVDDGSPIVIPEPALSGAAGGARSQERGHE